MHTPDAIEPPISSSTKPGILIRALICLHATATLALAVFAYQIINIHCESFGCMGIGAAWFAWVCGFALILVLGIAIRFKALTEAWKKFSTIAFCIQIMTGVLIIGRWIVHQ